MPEPEIAIIVRKVLKRQVNETCVADQNRDRQLTSVFFVAEYLRTVFRFYVRREFVRRQFGMLGESV